jgi:sugar phosphate isomerase/epimerase
MIFVSTACVRKRTIGDTVGYLAERGFRHIELSGGTKPYPAMRRELDRLAARYDLTYRLHNYFPPPPQPFVLNLASLNDEVHRLSMAHAKCALDLSREFDCDQYGLHAGFRYDIPVGEIGRCLSRQNLCSQEEAMKRFVESLDILQEYAREVTLYIENNVLSAANHAKFDENPFLVTDTTGHDALRQRSTVALLLDVAHLKVSAHSLNRDFPVELETLLARSDYLHLSDNDGLSDSNHGIRRDSPLHLALRNSIWRGKTVTLEVIEGDEALQETFAIAEELLATCNVDSD